MALTLGGCSGIGLLNAAQPGGGVGITRDLAYGVGERRTLDVYRPRKVSAPAPVVVFFYGGNWQTGAKADYAFAGKALARQGFVAIIPDYRLYPSVRYPDFLRDSAQAVRWARDHAAEQGGDPSRLFVMGHSAGAYNAVTLALDQRWLAEVGLGRGVLAGAIGLAGPYDFLPLQDETLKVIFGPEDQRPATQPITYAERGDPPLLLISDRSDQVVDPENVTRLAARVRAVGGEVESRIYERRLGHALVVGALAEPLRLTAPVMRDVRGFINRR